jgi:hypothetical protein
MLSPDDYYRPRRARELRRLADRLGRWIPALTALSLLGVIVSAVAFFFVLGGGRLRRAGWLFVLWMASYLALHFFGQMLDFPDDCREEADRLEREHRLRPPRQEPRGTDGMPERRDG